MFFYTLFFLKEGDLIYVNEEIKIGYYAVIPSTVLFNENLKPNEKLLYAVITVLSNKEGYCFASNNYLAKLFNSKPHTISNWISNLKKFNFIIPIDFLVSLNFTDSFIISEHFFNNKNLEKRN